MPETNKITVKAQEVKQGDWVVVYGKQGITTRTDSGEHFVTLTANMIKRGAKWVEARTEDFDGKLIFRQEIGTDVEVIRTQPTEEEHQAQRRAYYNDMILRFVENPAQDWAAAQAEFADKIKGGYDAERYSFVYSGLMYAHARHALKVELIQLYEGVRKNTNPDADWVEVWAMYREDKIESLIDYGFRGNSRSTSQISNLLEDVQHEVIARAVRRVEYPH